MQKECTLQDAAAPPSSAAPSPDWREIARDLAGALASCTHEIEQMRGMFVDEDGTIASAVEDADDATEQYHKAVAAAPAAPSLAERPAVWTLTTDGDNMAIETSVFPSQDAALGAACEVLRMSGKAMPDNLDTMTADEVSDLWGEIFDGACIIERHDIPAAD